MKNALESIGNIADYLEKKISELKYRNLEINQLDKERFFFVIKEVYKTIQLQHKKKHKANGYARMTNEEKGSSKLKEIKAANF